MPTTTRCSRCCSCRRTSCPPFASRRAACGTSGRRGSCFHRAAAPADPFALVRSPRGLKRGATCCRGGVSHLHFGHLGRNFLEGISMTARRASIVAIILAAVLALAVGGPAVSQTPKSGGTLNVTQREDLPQGFAVHETGTISTSWPAMPCLNNLVFFDPLKKVESLDTVIGELAEKWSWQDNYRNLVFFLRKGVKWHDGQPFTSKDVKFTFDMLREAPDAQGKLRINPRKDWYANLQNVEAPDPHTVIFHLKKPQPSLLLMLASGYSPVYAAHVPPASYRTGCIGTGPFKVKEWRKGEFVELVKNPDYFVKGRPYLDTLRYIIIVERGTRTAALQAAKLDVSFPGETTKTTAEQLKKAVPQLVVTPYSQNVNDNIIMNVKKPPFDNMKVRLAVSHAIDRRALVMAV